MSRLRQPPPSLRVEATIHQTRVLLDHGRPKASIKPWRRTAGVVFIMSLAIAWFLPFLLCPLSLPIAVLFLAVVAMDLGRTVDAALELRPDQLSIVTRDLMSLHHTRISWRDISEISLESTGRRRNRDAVRVRWTDGELQRSMRVGAGRNVEDLIWIKAALLTIIKVVHPESAAIVAAEREGEAQRVVAAIAAPEPAADLLVETLTESGPPSEEVQTEQQGNAERGK